MTASDWGVQIGDGVEGDGERLGLRLPKTLCRLAA